MLLNLVPTLAVRLLIIIIIEVVGVNTGQKSRMIDDVTWSASRLDDN